METLSLEQVKAYQGEYKVVPICRSMYADIRTPIEVLRIVKNISSHCYLLESMEDSQRWGRYTFIGYDPQMGLYCKDGTVHIKTGAEVQIHTDHPEQLISQILADNKAPRLSDLPPFTGGLVGYFAYDFIKYAEPSLKLNAVDDDGFNDFDLMLFDKVIVFDNLKQQIYLIVNVRLDSVEENYNRALLEMKRMESLICEGKKAPDVPLQLKSDFKPLFNEEEYCQMVEKGKNYIREGDIFQVVLANRLSAEAEGSLLDTYRVLRTINPSPYMFFFSGDDIELAGSSPETLTRLENGDLFTFLWPARGRGARRRKKTRPWKTNSCTIRRNWPNTTCSSTWAAMTWDASANSAASTSNAISTSCASPTSCTSARLSTVRYARTRRLSMPLPRSCRRAPCRGRRRSGPVKSSTNWKATNAASTAAPSATSTLPAIWTAASASAWLTRKAITSMPAPVRASSPTASPNRNIRNV